MDKQFCVISHTHWDREWYMPFEQFRIKLVDLVDNLLKILEEYPQYIFHLDAQTIVLEDYLEIRPYRKEAIQKYIKEGRLLVGPWFVQNDFYLTSGEATVRNLLIGSRIAEEMGKCTWVGYTPDQFGLISQLPQIFNGFGIDSCIFGRGYNFFKKVEEALEPLPAPSEFIWKGVDGSKVLAIHLPYWYSNAQRFSEDLEKSIKLLQKIENDFENITLSPYLLLMNGVDHLEAQENLVPILDRLNKRLPEGKTISQISMPEYLKKIRGHLEKPEIAEAISVYSGELRNGADYQVLQGTLSSRIYLKAANSKAQNLLENYLEPVYSFIYALDAEDKYPSDFLNYLWKLLIQNHAHDSICGCSRDEVHDHMEDRFKRIQEAGEDLLQRGLDFITAHLDRTGLTGRDYLITLFNPVDCTRSAVVEIEVQFPVDEEVDRFVIRDADGLEIPFILLSREKKHRDIFSPVNLPGTKEVDAFKIQFYVERLEGISYKALTVKPWSKQVLKKMETADEPVIPPVRMENEYLSVVVDASGRVDAASKETGKRYIDILRLEDSEDCGDSYAYGKAPSGKTLTSDGIVPEIMCISNTGFESSYSLVYTLMLPECFIRNTGLRSDQLVANKVEVILRLKKGCRQLDVDFNIENVSRDHRLRALIATGINTYFTHVSAPFDVMKRDRRDVLNGIKNGTQPNSGFIDISDGMAGVAVLNQGIYEYEHLLDDKGTIALTLLRANDKIEVNSRGDAWQVPGNQCIRRIRLNMALYIHAGDWITSGVVHEARKFQSPVLGYYQPVDTKKFVGGRPAVQDSAIAEIFHKKDPFSHIVLPHYCRLFAVQGKGAVVSAVKKSKQDESLVIRLYNCTNEESEFELTYFKPLKAARKLDMMENTIAELGFEGSILTLTGIKPKEIYTIAIK